MRVTRIPTNPRSPSSHKAYPAQPTHTRVRRAEHLAPHTPHRGRTMTAHEHQWDIHREYGCSDGSTIPRPAILHTRTGQPRRPPPTRARPTDRPGSCPGTYGPQLNGLTQRGDAPTAVPDPSQIRVVQPEEPLEVFPGRLAPGNDHTQWRAHQRGAPPAPTVTVATTPTACPKTNEYPAAGVSLPLNLVPILVRPLLKLGAARAWERWCATTIRAR